MRDKTLDFGRLIPRLIIGSIFVVIQLITSSLFAYESVKITPDKNTIRIGEQITLDIQIEGEEGMDYLFPSRQDTLVKKIEILEQTPTDTNAQENILNYSQKWTLTSFDTGVYDIPALSFLIFRDSIAGVDTLKSVPFEITVQTVPVDTTQTFKAIHDIYDAPEYPTDWTWYIVGGLALLVIAGLLYYFIQKSKKQDRTVELTQKKKPSEPAHIYALKKLDQLKEKKLWQSDKHKAYHSELTEIVRTYLELRFEVPALEKTSAEVLEIIQNRGVLETTQVESLKGILTVADMVKFAKKHPLPDDNQRSMEQAINLVESTKLVSNTDV